MITSSDTHSEISPDEYELGDMLLGLLRAFDTGQITLLELRNYQCALLAHADEIGIRNVSPEVWLQLEACSVAIQVIQGAERPPEMCSGYGEPEEVM